MSNNNNNIKRITLTALFAALSCIATLVIQVPTPTGGYVNLGDCFVLAGAFILGPVYGALAAGIGTMLADIISGYALYAPATFVIKALMAVTAYYIYKIMSRLLKGKLFLDIIASVISCICGEAVMVLGYFIYEAVILKMGLGAAAGIMGNTVQAAFAIVIGAFLHQILKRIEKLTN